MITGTRLEQEVPAAHWFGITDLLCDLEQELMIKINFVYNQRCRMDDRIQETLFPDKTTIWGEPLPNYVEPEWNQMRWDNLIKQRDARQAEFEGLLKAYNKRNK